MTWHLLTRWSQDQLETLAECTYMMRHLTWREVDGAWLGQAHGKTAAACYGTADEHEEDDMDTTTTYINPRITSSAVDRAWRIAGAYCRARLAVGLTPEIDDARALAAGDDAMVDAYRAAIYEWAQQLAGEAL